MPDLIINELHRNTRQADLETFTPASVLPLMAFQEVTRPSGPLASLARLAKAG